MAAPSHPVTYNKKNVGVTEISFSTQPSPTVMTSNEGNANGGTAHVLNDNVESGGVAQHRTHSSLSCFRNRNPSATSTHPVSPPQLQPILV
jgi:hypothetical protein